MKPTLENLKMLLRFLALLAVTGSAIVALPIPNPTNDSSNIFQSTFKQETVLEFMVERKF